jgi:hypothetical protein
MEPDKPDTNRENVTVAELPPAATSLSKFHHDGNLAEGQKVAAATISEPAPSQPSAKEQVSTVSTKDFTVPQLRGEEPIGIDVRTGLPLYYTPQEWKAKVREWEQRMIENAPTEEEEKQDEQRDILEMCQFRSWSKPEPARPVFTMSNVVICTPGNLAAITAQAKAGKTAFLGAMIAAPMVEPGLNADTFTVTSANPDKAAVIHFDTEQSPADWWNKVNLAVHRAGLSKPPEWLLSYCLTGKSANETRELVRFGIQHAADIFGAVHSVFIDGVADLVNNVNDPEECNAFVADLHGLAIVHDCPIISVIHFNPGSDTKTRGHLGSQIERKAETNLTLEKDGEITAVWSTKQRGAPIPKDIGPRFKWDNGLKHHVSCGSEIGAKTLAKIENLRCQRDDVFLDHPAMRYSDLVATVKKVLTVSDRTATRRIQEWCHYELIEKSAANLYTKVD